MRGCPSAFGLPIRVSPYLCSFHHPHHGDELRAIFDLRFRKQRGYVNFNGAVGHPKHHGKALVALPSASFARTSAWRALAWTSSNGGVVTVSNAPAPDGGIATGVAMGSSAARTSTSRDCSPAT